MIPQPPPLGSAGFQDHQILGAEQHRGQYSGDFRRGLLFRAVAPDLPGTVPVKQHPAQDLLPVLGMDLSLNLRKIRTEADHLSRFLGPEAFSAAEVGDGFQKVGLPLGIVPHDQIHSRLKFHRYLVVVAEGAQINLI